MILILLIVFVALLLWSVTSISIARRHFRAFECEELKRAAAAEEARRND